MLEPIESHMTLLYYNLSPLGGLICMTTRNVRDNVGYKASLEQELRLLEEERLLSRVHVTEVEELQLVVSTHEEGYMSGAVYLYRVSEPLSR